MIRHILVDHTNNVRYDALEHRPAAVLESLVLLQDDQLRREFAEDDDSEQIGQTRREKGRV